MNWINDPRTWWMDNLSNCLMYALEKFVWLQRDSNPRPLRCRWVQCSYQLSYEATQLRAGQFIGLMCSREISEWRKEMNISEVWMIGKLKKWSSQVENLSTATASQRSRVRIPLKSLEFFKCIKDTIAQIVHQVRGSFLQFISYHKFTCQFLSRPLPQNNKVKSDDILSTQQSIFLHSLHFLFPHSKQCSSLGFFPKTLQLQHRDDGIDEKRKFHYVFPCF